MTMRNVNPPRIMAIIFLPKWLSFIEAWTSAFKYFCNILTCSLRGESRPLDGSAYHGAEALALDTLSLTRKIEKFGHLVCLPQNEAERLATSATGIRL